ncbi:MAG: hypothetical protein IPL31_04790 [Saprospiraceae bacterium]|nr:hypothetical protein [Saprospiraceae bacterium]
MENVTYLFGAGASANAIPTYTREQGSFTIAFRQFIDLYFIQTPSNINFTSPPIDIEENLLQSIKIIYDEVYIHYSVDTFARKLYLQNTDESLALLKLLKCLISFYIEYVQIFKYEKRLNLDQRYDVFFSAILLKTDQFPMLPDNISLLFWNYDNQMELTLSNFNSSTLAIENIQNQYGILPNKKPIDEIKKDIQFIRHIKLNGHSGNHVNYKPNSNKIDTINSPSNVFKKANFEKRLKNAIIAFNPTLIDSVKIDFFNQFCMGI